MKYYSGLPQSKTPI